MRRMLKQVNKSSNVYYGSEGYQIEDVEWGTGGGHRGGMRDIKMLCWNGGMDGGVLFPSFLPGRCCITHALTLLRTSSVEDSLAPPRGNTKHTSRCNSPLLRSL